MVEQRHTQWSSSTRASIAMLLLFGGASGCNHQREGAAATRMTELKQRLDEDEEINRLAEAQVANVPEPRRVGARVMAAQAIRLNRQGFTCAEVINASALPGTDAVVVTCREALFEDQTVRYRVDPRTGETTKL